MGQAISCRSMLRSSIKKMRVKSPKKLPEPVDEKKQLKPVGMRSLLEQAFKLKNSSGESVKCFSTIMFNSKRFCNVARYYPVYRFGIQIESQRTYFMFMSQANDYLTPVGLKLKKACKLVRFLNPALTVIRVELDEDEEFPCSKLLSLVKGKIHFKFSTWTGVQIMSHRIETYWHQIVELHCVAAALSPTLPVKSFKLLDVQGIEHADRMRAILRHNVKHLSLGFWDHTIDDANMLLPDVGRIETCTLSVSGFGLLPAVRFVVNNYPNLKHLKVSYRRMNSTYSTFSTRFIVEDVLVRTHDTYNQVFNLLTQSSIDSTLSMIEGYFHSYRFMLSTNWTGALFTRNEFRKVQQETKVNEEGIVITTFSDEKKSSNVTSKFSMFLDYRYGINLADVANMDGMGDV